MDQYIGRFLDNRYEILELIGTGGMAVVYKARCHRLNRLVAIKILKDDFSREEEFRRRFHAEGEAVASLSHPNIVQVYDVSSSDNANFIVMELIDGITLKQYMAKKGTLNWKETLHFAIQIAKALEHAHGRSIVHRDIKPHNVMVLKNGSVKVTDFGIARVMSKSNTLTKEALGSVHYISPEQAKGGWLDNRSDLYSLSVVMYEMMTGRPPYDGESPVAVAIKHINGGAPAPSTLNPNIPSGLEQIIMKGMALDVKDRYISATEMLQDMDQFRMNPAIHFGYSQGAPADATIVLQPEKVAEAVRQSRAAAERVASQTGDLPMQQAKLNTPKTAARTTQQPKTRSASEQRARSSKASHADEDQFSTLPRRKTREEIRREVREEERNRAATIAVVVCSAVAIIAILIFLVVLVNGGLVGRGENLVYVPDLRGDSYEQARDVAGLVIEIDKYANSDEYEKGEIISHVPEYGAQVRQGTAVKVTISLGAEPEAKTMSYMIGYQEADARAVLTGMGMVPVAMEEFSDIIEKGKVSRTDPAFGEVLTEGQTVYIYISKGPLIETAEMPNLVGLDYATAKKALEELGFDNVNFERKDGKQDKDEVIEQPYKKGEKVDITSEIVLTISKGNGKETPKTPEKPKTEQTTSNKNNTSSNTSNDYVPQQSQTSTQSSSQSNSSGSSSSSGSGSSTVNKSKSKEVTISLPSDRSDQYLLGIYQNNMQVIEDSVISPDRTSIKVVLTGSGVQSYDLYINNQFYKTVKVDFNAND